MSTSRKRSIQFMACLMVVLLIMPFYLFNPEKYIFFPKCPFYVLTGLCCPGCGSQRALHDLLHLKLHDAFKHNALMVLLLPYVVVYFINDSFCMNDKIKRLSYNNYFVWAILIIIILFWILRNIPIFLFHYYILN